MNKNIPAPLDYTLASQQSAEQVIDLLKSNATTGLTNEQVTNLNSIYGKNQIETSKTQWTKILLRQLKSPFVYILLIAGLLALSLKEWIDGSMIFLFIIINALLGFFQEFRSEQTVQQLKKFTATNADTLRNQKWQKVLTSEIVPGDIVNIHPGDIVPADIRLIKAYQLVINESILSGESEGVNKQTEHTANCANIHIAKNIAFTGSNVISGHGYGVVFATGKQTYLGQVAKLAIETTRLSSFEKGMNTFSHFILKLILSTLLLIFIANFLIKGGSTNLSEMALFTIALAASVIPEALPLVITFSLSRGAMRLSKHKVVVKRLSAIEDLGGIEVLCTDKTGTLTENKMAICEVYGNEKLVLLQAQTVIDQKSKLLDPFDQAIELRLQQLKLRPVSFDLLHNLPFDPDRKRSSALVSQMNKSLLVVRGAAEAITPFLKSKIEKPLFNWIEEQENLGRRIILVAQKNMIGTNSYDKNAEESNLNMIGAIALADPLKKSASSAIAKANRLGVEIKIITGDSPIVAKQIALQAKLITTVDQVITADQFFSLSEIQQQQIASKTKVFARFSPTQKYKLIEILQQKKEVGYIGDGINDAPALKLANVAVAVNEASDIARESADVILLNSSLEIIINGIEEGRRVFANTVKYIKITLAANFGNFYAIALVTLFIPYLPMLPIQILLLNLLSDFPSIAIATDTIGHEEVRKPESYNLKDFAITALIFGIVSSAFDFLFFAVFVHTSPAILQTNWFIGSVMTELALLYSLRSHLPFFRARFPSKSLIFLTIFAAILSLLLPLSKIGQSWFHFVPPTKSHILIIITIATLYFLINEVVKKYYYQFLVNGIKK